CPARVHAAETVVAFLLLLLLYLDGRQNPRRVRARVRVKTTLSYRAPAFTRAMILSSLASASCGLALASFSQPLQQTNTGRSLTITLRIGPTEPSRLSSSMAQKTCASASRRSSGLSLAIAAWIFASSALVIGATTPVAAAVMAAIIGTGEAAAASVRGLPL